jgi:C_GCAxxG_C_C family probable redox protein
MTSKSVLVNERFSQFNCAQTVFSLYASELGLDEKTALRIASGFGGGMTRAKTCGAVTGAYMVIGLKHGHDISDPEKKANTKMLIQKFNREFEKRHGSLICKKLIGFDISKPEGSEAAGKEGVFETKCPLFLKTSCEIIEKEFL